MAADQYRSSVQSDATSAERAGSGPRVASEQQSSIRNLEQNLAEVLLGKSEAIRLAVVALLAGGHVLIEDAPGVGKTSLAKALARSVDCDFARLQFTPDMLPSDILGASVYLPNRGEFEFRKGPIFTNILLVDEINRTTPRTQSALLEAMSEGQVSIEGQTYLLSRPFLVLATQNPYEIEGTYPLPENQLDRFMLCTGIGYPERAVEMEVLARHRDGEAVDSLQPVLSADEVIQLQQHVSDVVVEESISDYLLNIVHATRSHDELELGVSTRGALTLYRAAQSLALVQNRDYVVPDDVKELAVPVLAHRVAFRGLFRDGDRTKSESVIRQILDEIPVPA